MVTEPPAASAMPQALVAFIPLSPRFWMVVCAPCSGKALSHLRLMTFLVQPNPQNHAVLSEILTYFLSRLGGALILTVPKT